MTKKALYTFALALGLTGVFATNNLSAQMVPYSEKISIPFAFHAGNIALPAGEYRLERVFGKEVVSLVNLKTGQRVQLLRQDAGGTPGKARLQFEVGPGGYSLKKLS